MADSTSTSASDSAWDGGIEFSTHSDIGLRRNNNQDSLTAVTATSVESWRHRGHLFLVADGMGAHAAGELASKLAVDTVPLSYDKSLGDGPAIALRRAVEDANDKIHSKGQANAEFHGMGTTASALSLVPAGALVAHVGDSRVYRLRGMQLEQLSFDHSLVWEMMAGGRIREEEVPSFIPKNVITRSLGPNPVVQVDLEGPFPVRPGDTFLLCSDGLTGQVKDRELGAVLAALRPAEATQALIDLANLRGGPDNITAIVVRVKGPPLTQESADASPETSSKSGAERGGLHPIVAALIALSALVADAWLLSHGLALAAAVATAGTLALIVLLWRLSAGKTQVDDDEITPLTLGSGPYKNLNCTPDAELIGEFARLSRQLRAAAVEEAWDVSWPKFNQWEEGAAKAAEEARPTDSVRDYCRAISFLMGEVRKQGAGHASTE